MNLGGKHLFVGLKSKVCCRQAGTLLDMHPDVWKELQELTCPAKGRDSSSDLVGVTEMQTKIGAVILNVILCCD